MAGKHAGADALFVSPIHPTRSHDGTPGIGPAQAMRIGRGLGIPMIALGGMTESHWRRIQRFGFHGWAAIDAWMPIVRRHPDESQDDGKGELRTTPILLATIGLDSRRA